MIYWPMSREFYDQVFSPQSPPEQRLQQQRQADCRRMSNHDRRAQLTPEQAHLLIPLKRDKTARKCFTDDHDVRPTLS
jgi:hypothetical protein